MEFPVDKTNIKENASETIVAPKEKRYNTSFKSTSASGVTLDSWRTAKVKLEEAKAREKELRSHVELIVRDTVNQGVNRYGTDYFVLKLTRSPKYTVDGSNLQMLNQALGTIYQMCGGEVANSLIKWTPTLDKKTYDALPDEARAIIDPYLTLTFVDSYKVDE